MELEIESASDSEQEHDDRRKCNSCGEKLAHSAYFRHLHDLVGSICPGKVQPCDRSDSEADTSDISEVLQLNSSFDLDSTFDLGSESDGCGFSEAEQLPLNDSFDSSGPSDISNSDDSGTCTPSSDGEEVWELSESESGDDSSIELKASETTSNLLLGITLFLNIFHLCHRLSERAMFALLEFLRSLFAFIAAICHNQILFEIANTLPKSLYTIRKRFRKVDGFTEYVVCPKCSTLYTFAECIIQQGNITDSRRCEHIEFPNHPHSARRSKCNTILMKRVKVNGKSKLVPKKVFVYQSVIQSLQEMATRPGFLQMCEHWRYRSDQVSDGTLGDIYDGQVWKSLHTINDRPFLSVPNNLTLGLNIDWFNPFDKSPYSAGAIYLTVFNLPRSERFKLENIILVGMIPGPNEQKNVNPFLKPLVEELKELYQGITFRNSSSLLSVTTIRALLSCVMCDLPATRKVCGFSNYNARRGCSKCLKEFPTDRFGLKPNYSGYDCNNWVPRDITTHRTNAFAHYCAATATERNDIERSYGSKYSELLNLPFFDIVRYHVVDPMHNIFLGIAKHSLKTWKDLHIIDDKKDYAVIQEKVDSMNPPFKLGRIPRKIGSGFASFTADEWKYWILMYSLYSLHGVLPDSHYKCWCLFVDACRLLCLPVVTESQINAAHSRLVDYCKTFESLYGPEHCTPNMHMACHLKECMLDYGPLSSFWCFAFERYNGTLEGVQKSWNGPEKQMLAKFIDMQYMYTLQTSTVVGSKDDFMTLVCKNSHLFKNESRSYGSLHQFALQDVIIIELKCHDCAASMLDAEEKPFQSLISPLKEKCFSDTELSYLRQMYMCLYPNSRIERLSRFYYQSKQLNMNSEEFISTGSRSQRSPAIAAHWPGVLSIDPRGEAPLRIGIVTCFVRHEISFIQDSLRLQSSSTVSHVLAHVKWYMDHPRRNFFHPSIIVCASVYDADSPACYMPVSRIAGRCAIASTTIRFDYGEDSVIVAVPLLKGI